MLRHAAAALDAGGHRGGGGGGGALSSPPGGGGGATLTSSGAARPTPLSFGGYTYGGYAGGAADDDGYGDYGLGSTGAHVTPLPPPSPSSCLPPVLGSGGGGIGGSVASAGAFTRTTPPLSPRDAAAGMSLDGGGGGGGGFAAASAALTAAAAIPTASDATGQSEWLDQFMASSVGGLPGGFGAPAATSASDAAMAGSEVGSYTYAGDGTYVLSEVRRQATQMRAALKFDEHKLSSDDAAAYEVFRNKASAFRTWRAMAHLSKEEANTFRAAVNRWLMAVGYWESRLLGKCVAAWSSFRGLVERRGEEVAARHRRRVVASVLQTMHATFTERYAHNAKLVQAVAFFGAHTARATFTKWRDWLLQQKAWFLRGEAAHLERAFAQMRKGCTGAARAGHLLMRSAGLDDKKRVRAAFNRLVSHAQKLVGVMAAVGYWRAGAIRACLLTLYRFAQARSRHLRLIRGALSHHSSVLLQAVLKEWFIAVRHDVIARSAWERASLAVGFSRWSEAFRTLAALEAVAMGFVELSETALVRQTLKEWHLATTRRLARSAKVGMAAVHAWMSLTALTFEGWKKYVRDEQQEREGLAKAARRWHEGALSRAWNSWLGYAGQRARYMHVAAQIASSTASGLRGLVWGAWVQMHTSSLRLRQNILAEAKVRATRKWFAKLDLACAASRAQKTALRALAGSSAARVLQMHFGAWLELKVTRKRLDAVVRLHLKRIFHAHLAKGLLTWLAYHEESLRLLATMTLCLKSFTNAAQGRAFRSWGELTAAALAARERMSRALGRLTKRALLRGFLSWVEMADEKLRKREPSAARSGASATGCSACATTGGAPTSSGGARSRACSAAPRRGSSTASRRGATPRGSSTSTAGGASASSPRASRGSTSSASSPTASRSGSAARRTRPPTRCACAAPSATCRTGSRRWRGAAGWA